MFDKGLFFGCKSDFLVDKKVILPINIHCAKQYFSSDWFSFHRSTKQDFYCRSLIKVKFSTDKVRRALGSGGCRSID